MGLKVVVLLGVAVLTTALAVLNWSSVVAPANMSLGFVHVTAPFGLIMLALMTVLGLASIASIVGLQIQIIRDRRRHIKDIDVQRSLADNAEASRFTELRNLLEIQERMHQKRSAEDRADVIAQLKLLDESVAALRNSLIISSPATGPVG